MTDESMANRDQLTRLAVAFTRLGITDRADRLRLLSDAVGRLLYSSSRLTYAEADTIERRLKTAHPAALRAHVAALVRAEEHRARAAATPPPVCPATWCEDDACTGTHTDTPPDPIDQAVALLRSAGMLAEEPA